MADNKQRKLKVLAMGAHPDDVEFTCAGTLALLAEGGCSIVVASLTPGDCGSADMPPHAIAGKRRREAQNAAALLGAPYACLEFHDLSIFADDSATRRVTEFIRGVRPDLVFAPSPQDYMADHENTSALVRNACFYAPIRNYVTRPSASSVVPTSAVPALYYCDPIAGKDVFGQTVTPHLLVNISRTIDVKTDMLACHESQREWMKQQHGVDEYLEQMKAWSAERGRPADWEYAEGFRQHRGHPYPTQDMLGELLGDRVRHL